MGTSTLGELRSITNDLNAIAACSIAEHVTVNDKRQAGPASAFFGQICPLMTGAGAGYCLCMATAKAQSEHDAILKTLQLYIDGCKQGNSQLMRPAFLPQASFFGYAGDQLAVGLEFLFDWIDRNGPSPNMETRIVSVDIAESVAVVRLEVAKLSGNLAGANVCMSDFFTLLKMSPDWRIIQKAFHWHS